MSGTFGGDEPCLAARCAGGRVPPDVAEESRGSRCELRGLSWTLGSSERTEGELAPGTSAPVTRARAAAVASPMLVKRMSMAYSRGLLILLLLIGLGMETTVPDRKDWTSSSTNTQKPGCVPFPAFAHPERQDVSSLRLFQNQSVNGETDIVGAWVRLVCPHLSGRFKFKLSD